MEILKLDPAIKDYLWGGRKLVEKFNKVTKLLKHGKCQIIKMVAVSL